MRPSQTSREAPRYRNYESTSSINYSAPQRSCPQSYTLHEEADLRLNRPPRHHFTTINSNEQTSGNQDESLDASNISQDANANDMARPKAKMVFPCVLYRMLQDADEKGHEDIVSWVSQGRAFRVHNTKKFVSSILPKYFAQTKITSFQRQVNMYCFVRITSGQDKGAYYHRHFVRGEPQLCDNIVRMPFKGKKGRTYSAHESDPDVHTADVVETSMTRDEPAQSIFNCNADMVHSDHELWHDPQQPVQYSDAYMLDSRYALGARPGDHLETYMSRRESAQPINHGNAQMNNSEHATLRNPKQPVQYYVPKTEDSKYAWGTHTKDHLDSSMMPGKPMSSIIHSNTDTTNYLGHKTLSESYVAKKTEYYYARRAHSRDYMDISTEPQEPISSITYSNTEPDKSRPKMLQNLLQPVQYHNLTAASTYAWSTPFTDDNISQLRRMNDRHLRMHHISHHFYGTETKIPAPNPTLSYSLSKDDDEVSSFCSTDW
jgi:hypothetical protein